MKEKLLKDLILQNYKSMKEFARKLNMPPSTIEGIIKRGLGTGKTETMLTICESFNIDLYALMEGYIKEKKSDPFRLTLKEKHLIEDYRSLDQYGVEVVDTVLSLEKDRNIFYDNKIKFMWLPFPDTRASAGTGQEMLEYSEFVKIPRTEEAETCDFVVKIAGDSMVPMFDDGDCVLVKSTKELNIGDIGLFILNNEGFIKEFGDGCLISKNPDYEPIRIGVEDTCLIIGKIVSKTEICD